MSNKMSNIRFQQELSDLLAKLKTLPDDVTIEMSDEDYNLNQIEQIGCYLANSEGQEAEEGDDVSSVVLVVSRAY